jgi:hypothetical protein
MAKPKLALIPAAQGSKFYSVLPSDGVGDFDFARASAATRINKYGLIETVASGQSRLNYPLIDGVVNGCPHHLLDLTASKINCCTSCCTSELEESLVLMREQYKCVTSVFLKYNRILNIQLFSGNRIWADNVNLFNMLLELCK